MALLAGLMVSCGTMNVPIPEARVDGKREVRLPKDHAAHDEFANEWWYYAGVVKDESGTEYAFHVAFFKHWATNEWRFGIPARWFGNPVQFAQGAVTDLASGKRVVKEVMGSRTLGTVGARSDRLCVWTSKWHVQDSAGGSHVMRADLGGAVLDLKFSPTKPWVVHGQRGKDPISRSHYSSCTRMSVSGTLKSEDSEKQVSGTGWADHEIMGPDVARGSDGWDWFALQLNDGSELVHYSFRSDRSARSADGFVSKRAMTAWIDKKGTRHELRSGECKIEPVAHWTSPRSGVRFPVRWKLKISRLGIDLDFEPSFKDGELYGRVSRVRYWEGVVHVTGSRNGRPLSGHGYVELTGYGKPLRSL